MGYDNDASKAKVLERTGDGSRTVLELEAEAARKFAQAMSAQPPARMRPMEAVWILICLVLLVAYFEKSDVSDQVIAERHKLLQTCERNTRVAVAALNGWELQEGDVKVACKRVKS
jgi:hypothetical protein